MGVPTGPHGAFRDYQVDAITLEISPKVSPDKMISRSPNEFILRGGRYVSLIQVLLITILEEIAGNQWKHVEVLQLTPPICHPR